MSKKINYLARNFDDIKTELINFSKKYYPELSDSFNDASVGAWFIDLMSAVGDDLSYHTDRIYQETNINTASLKSSVYNTARMNGVKIPGPKPSLCEVELSCVLPVDNVNISLPNWKYAPLVKRNTIVGNNSYDFELMEDVNFAEQFNSNGVSNRRFVPIRNNNGVITSYQVYKSVLAISGKSKIYKKVLTEDDVYPFMEIILPEQNIMNIESIIFKESVDFNVEPDLYEFYIDEEIFNIKNQEISTYRYFEVNSLADQYRFGSEMNYNEDETLIIDENNPEKYVDYNENNEPIYRYFKGKWKPITQKFITEYTDNGFLKIIFGGANENQIIPEKMTNFNEYIVSKIINNDMLGILPKAGWTMYVLYRIDGGVSTNLPQGAINTVINANVIFPSTEIVDNNETAQIKNNIIDSLSVINLSTSLGGKDMPSSEEIKYLTKYNISAQNRCVTLKDYKAKIMSIPPKYGCPFRCNVIEENNKIVMPLLGLNSNGNLDTGLPQILIDNLIEYLSQYKTLGDYIEMKSGKIYNIGFEVDAFIDKNYVSSEVVNNIINTVKDYMDVNKHDMGEDIFIGDLEKTITNIDGVISLIDLRVYALYSESSGIYSKDICPLPKYVGYNDKCEPINDEFYNIGQNGKSFRIDLGQTDGLLLSNYNSMYEILNPESDICVRIKLK